MKNIGLVFPGQGSQRIGMAKDYYENFKEAKETFEEASSVLSLDMKKLCFEENDKLNLTEYTQVAILTAELSMFYSLKKHFALKPQYFAGHSLGEYSALISAEVIPFSKALQIVRERGILMQSTCSLSSRHSEKKEASMIALIAENIDSLDLNPILLKHSVEIANQNASNQIVISSYPKNIKAFLEEFQQKYLGKVKCVPLNVSIPFHSSIMKSIEEKFSSHLENFKEYWNKENVSKVFSNFTGTLHIPEELNKNLIKQISSPVLWLQNMKEISQLCDTIYEIGPNRPLSPFFSSINVSCTPILSVRNAKRIFDKR